MLKIQKAQKKQLKLRMAITGPTGSGKTLGALKLAQGLGGKIGLIDTENGSSQFYSDLVEYDIIDLKAPYSPEKYLEAIDAFESAGYENIIIDSLTHAWAGEGGILEIKGDIDARGGNSYTNWREPTKLHTKLLNRIVHGKSNFVVTMRSKMTHAMETNEKGKQAPVKVGLEPVQRDGVEYEFDIVLDVHQKTHKAQATKDRSRIFGDWFFSIERDTGEKIKTWLNSGKSKEEEIEDIYVRLKSLAKDSNEFKEIWYALTEEDRRLLILRKESLKEIDNCEKKAS